MDFFRDNSHLIFWIGNILIVVFVVMFSTSRTVGIKHQGEALPLHVLIVKLSGFISFVCVLGGILAILLSSSATTSFELLGAKFNTTHVGVAFVGIGLLVGYFTVRAVLKNQQELAQIPETDESGDA
jgi:hypothetical protein